jgi:hypothetical protein
MANQTIADNKKSSDASFLIVNQNITSLDTKVAENTTAINANTNSIGTINTKLTDQQNQISDNRNQITATNNNLNNQIEGLKGQINSTNATNLTGLPLTTGVTGTLPVANGGTGATTLTANNVLLGNGTSALQAVAPGATGNVLTSNGTTWTSAAASGGTHTIGESYGGGKVFYVTTGGLHGLIAETQDQSSSCSWYNAQNVISNPDNHSTEGKKFTDWRLPTQYELNLMYNARSTIGGFGTFYYWSSTETAYYLAWYQNFLDGVQDATFSKDSAVFVRAIRAF